MIPDQLLRLADGQAIAGSTSGTNTIYTDVVDLDVVRDIGSGETLYVRIRFDTTYTQSPAGGTNIVLAYGESASLANAVTLLQLPFNSGAIPAAGSVYYLPIPPIAKDKLAIPGSGLKKYFGVRWEIYGTGSVVTDGTWTVDVVTETNMCEHTYTKGFTVQ